MILPSPVIQSPRWMYTKHLQTIIPNVYRRVEGVFYQRERISTWDNDFIDLDWSKVGSPKLVLLLHGFEGSSERVYAKGLTRMLNEQGFDVCAMNLRGCSGEDNIQLYSYHSGKTDDVDWVVQHIAATPSYSEIYMVGISLGGNLTMKYLGEELWDSVRHIQAAVAVSVPVHYETSFQHLIKGWNKIYERRFTKQVKEKVRRKMSRYPGVVDYNRVLAARNLWEFTAAFTVPIHGFKDVDDYNKQVQAYTYLGGIRTPVLLINADNDPLLTKECYPLQQASDSKFLDLEITRNGGHVGFCEDLNEKHNWLEKRITRYLLQREEI